MFGFKPDIWDGKESIRFKVDIEKEIECPTELLTYCEGWHLSDLDLAEIPEKESQLDPKFFPPSFLQISLTDHGLKAFLILQLEAS